MEVDEEQNYRRTIEDVNSMVEHAKLSHGHLTKISQALYYPTHELMNECNDYRLLELTPDLLEQIEANNVLSFKGGLNEPAVLCTTTKTYDIQEAEISNSLLLVPGILFAKESHNSPLKSPKGGMNKSADSSIEEEDTSFTEREVKHCQVLKIFHEYLECREIRPRIQKIYDLLQLTRYSGPELEYKIDRNLLFTYKQLLDTCQCSEAEFNNILKKYRTVEVDGKIRMLSTLYEFRVIELMLHIIEENSWQLNEINKSVTIESLNGIIPEDISTAFFDRCTVKNKEDDNYIYNQEIICRIIAQNILQPGTKFRKEEFFETWISAVPIGMEVNEEYLRGIGIVDTESKPESVKALDSNNLPEAILDRLNLLFRVKDKWGLAEIEPYIECFSTPQTSVTSLLAKHARAITNKNGQRVYVSKH